MEPTLNRNEVSQQVLNEFLNRVRVLVNAPDKFAIFDSLLTFPIETTTDTKNIFDALLKIYDGQNPVRKMSFIVPEAANDYEAFRLEKMLSEQLRKQQIHVMKQEINAIRIVDLPAEQVTSLPEPYTYTLDVSCAIDWAMDGYSIKWLIFRQTDTSIVVLDDTSYRVFKTKEKANEIDGVMPISEAPHDLAYCPANFVWSDPISENEPDLKLSPLTTHLPDFDDLLFWSTSKKHHELYASWQVTWAFESECDYSETSLLHGYLSCDQGKLKGKNGYIATGQNTYLPCPRCGNKPLAGAGSLIRVPLPKQDGIDLRPPVGFIAPDRALLDFRAEENEEIRERIFSEIVGYGGEAPNDQAVNEKQILAAFEAWERNLIALQTNIDRDNEWTEYTICKLRYADKFEDCFFSSGTKHYLLDANTILAIYTQSRKDGADSNILDALYEMYLMAEYRNNPEKLYEEKIKTDLDPLRHLDTGQVNNLWANRVIDEKTYQLKLKFPTFVKKFEREQAPLTVFGENLPYSKKIDAISQILLSYGQTITRPEPVPAV